MLNNNPNNKEKKCEKCKGAGWYQYSGFTGGTPHSTICDECCTHSKGFWELKEHYGERNGKMCCLNGCGFTREKTKDDLVPTPPVEKEVNYVDSRTPEEKANEPTYTVTTSSVTPPVEKKCSEYHKSPMQVCLCSCHKSGQLTQGCDFPISTPPVENRTDGTGVPSGLEMRTDTGSPQSNTMELDEKLEDLFNEAVRACLKHLKSEITEKERDEILKDLDIKGKTAIQNALSQVRKETIRELKEKGTISLPRKPVIVGLWVVVIGLLIAVYLINKKPTVIERTTIYYATFTPEGELKVEEPKINKSMGCNIYWRAKGYPCYDY